MLQEAEKFVDQKVAGIKGGTLNQFEHHHELRALPPKGLNPAGAQTGHSSGIASSHTDSISFNSALGSPAEMSHSVWGNQRRGERNSFRVTTDPFPPNHTILVGFPCVLWILNVCILPFKPI